MTAVAPDEDALVIPSGWFYPRRGGQRGFVRKFLPDAVELAAALVTESQGPAREAVIVDPEFTADPTSPLAAAVDALVTRHAVWRHFRRDLPESATYRQHGLQPFVDAWIEARGLGFALHATMELANLRLPGKGGPPWVGTPPAWYVRRLTSADTNAGVAPEDCLPIPYRIRGVLTYVSDDAYEAATEIVAGYRDGTPAQRHLATFLIPTRRDWVDADLDDLATSPADARYLAAATVDVEQLDRIVAVCGTDPILSTAMTVLDGVGHDAASRFVRWAEQSPSAFTSLRGALGLIPTDDALSALLDRLDDPDVLTFAVNAIQRFPKRALRLLAARLGRRSAAGRIIDELFRGHVQVHRALLTDDLPSDVHAAAKPVLQALDVPTAAADALPAVLATPPWNERSKGVKPLVVAGITPPDAIEVRWSPGERDEWRAWRPEMWWDRPDRDWAEMAAKYRAGKLESYYHDDFFVSAPDEYTVELFPDWQPESHWYVDRVLRPLAARYEMVALPHTLRAARRSPQNYATCLAPFVSAEIAGLMAEWATRSKSARPVARAWLRRHEPFAATALIPAAVGKAGRTRTAAEGALRLLDADVVRAAAATYGEQARKAVDGVLTSHPLYLLPAKMPALPDWLDPGVLPPVLLADRRCQLSPEAIRHVLTMCALSKPDEPYAGIDEVTAACDARSLAEFSWALFERWQFAGSPANDDWILTSLGLFGDDEVVRALAPLIRAWPAESGSVRAAKGLDVLAAIGSDAAVSQLYSISQRIRFKALKEKAAAKVEAIAAERNLTVDQLGDRCVPDLGLDEQGTLVLDFGPRRFTVGFDEALTPFVIDETGRRLKQLPKPGKTDDSEPAPTAYKTFGRLKKDARTVAAQQILRIELAMMDQRSWTGQEFRTLLVEHPLLRHVIRRLIWQANGTAFRVAEDGSFADASDDAFVLDHAAEVRIAHPLNLTDQARWAGVLADYEIVQPFPQLTRETYPNAAPLDWAGLQVPGPRILTLERRGWLRGRAGDSAVMAHLYRPIAGGRAVFLCFDPGMEIWDVGNAEEQKLEPLLVGSASTWPNGESDFDELDAITVSEIARDLTELTHE